MNDMINITQNLFIPKTRLYYSFFGVKKGAVYFLCCKEIKLYFLHFIKTQKIIYISVLQIFKIGLNNAQKNNRAFQQVFNKIANPLCSLALSTKTHSLLNIS